MLNVPKCYHAGKCPPVVELTKVGLKIQSHEPNTLCLNNQLTECHIDFMKLN